MKNIINREITFNEQCSGVLHYRGRYKLDRPMYS